MNTLYLWCKYVNLISQSRLFKSLFIFTAKGKIGCYFLYLKYKAGATYYKCIIIKTIRIELETLID